MFDENKSLVKGTGGLFVHPSLRASTANSTSRSFSKRKAARSFIASDQFNLSGTFVMPTKSQRYLHDEIESAEHTRCSKGHTPASLKQRYASQNNMQRLQRNNPHLFTASTPSNFNAMLSHSMNILSTSTAKKGARNFRRIDTGTSRDMEETQKWDLHNAKSPPLSSPGRRRTQDHT